MFDKHPENLAPFCLGYHHLTGSRISVDAHAIARHPHSPVFLHKSAVPVFSP